MPRLSPTLAGLALLLALPACNLFDPKNDGGGPGPSDPTTDLARVALQAHDQVRSSASPTPSPALPSMQWSSDVEAVAAQWAAHCVYQHDADRGNLGENIAASSPGYWPTIAGVVAAWASEAADYDYASNTCAAGEGVRPLHPARLARQHPRRVRLRALHCQLALLRRPDLGLLGLRLQPSRELGGPAALLTLSNPRA